MTEAMGQANAYVAHESSADEHEQVCETGSAMPERRETPRFTLLIRSAKVRVGDAEKERRAVEIMKAHSGKDVHVHDWSV